MARGSVYEQRPGLWAAAVDLGWVDGKRRRKTVYAKTEAEAVRRRDELRRRHELGEDLTAKPRTFGDWLDEWLVMKTREETRPSTLRGYRWLINTHVRPSLGKVSMDKLTPTVIRRLLSAKADSGLSSTTVRHIHGMIRNVLGDAVREELLHRKPALAVRAPSVRQIERRALTVEEAKYLIEVVRGDRLEALWVCALTVGLRRGELLGLGWSDLNLAAGTLTVRQTLLRVDGQLCFSEPKTDRSRRTVPLPDRTVELLRAHRRRQAAERLQARERWQDFGLIFASTIGTPMEPRDVGRAWHVVRTAAGLP